MSGLRSDHLSLPISLSLPFVQYHIVCLGWQLNTNFSLLELLDEKIDAAAAAAASDDDPVNKARALPSRILSKLTAVSWAAHLMLAGPCPMSVKLGSVACIYAAYTAAPASKKYWSQLAYVQVGTAGWTVDLISATRPAVPG